MYQNLKSKLELYKTGQIKKSCQEEKTGLDVHDIIEGSACSNDNGSCYVIENRYPVTYLHGGCCLGDAQCANMPSMRRVCRDLPLDANIEDFLFLDTETTGLSGGTGTVAFLAGAGFFLGDEFVLRQYFMRDYDEEPAMLTALDELLSDRKGLVTFNGKSFDWNLLQSRFTFNRMRPALKDPIHMDLLFPSRRIWRLKLESCRLTSLEENILGEYRIDDIPGAQIPSIYFEYLDSRDATDIKRVIKHNELDILSLVSLMVRISCKLDNPLGEADGAQELLGLGRIFEANGEYATVIHCFENCMESEILSVKDAASRRLSNIYKRSGNYSRAVEHWESMLADSKMTDIFPLIELAKYYEHREKDVSKAIDLVEKAMKISSRVGFMNNLYYNDLKKRIERLKRKAGRK